MAASSNNPTDLDGDSQMQSSSSDSDAMFPDESGPTTPQPRSSALRNYLQNQAVLSPPGSQEPGGRQIRSEDIMDTGDQHLTTSSGNNPFSDPSESKDAHSKSMEGKPGWGWQNPKAKEDYERSMEHVLDKEFNLREFGEIFSQEDIVKATGLKL